jgi:hypothetical protein
MQFAGAFLISRLGGSRRRFGRTIALWGLNRSLLFAVRSVLVPLDQRIVPTSYFRANADAIVLTNRKIGVVRLPQSGFVQVHLEEACSDQARFLLRRVAM